MRDLGRGLLGRGQRFDQLVVVEDVALGVAQQEQDAVLNFLKLLLHLGVGHHCIWVQTICVGTSVSRRAHRAWRALAGFEEES